MQLGNSVLIAIVLFLSIIPFHEVVALSVSSVSLNSLGLTVDLTFPEEAHPTETIMHNLTITAQKSLTMYNFTLVISALVDSTWQQVYKEYIPMTSMAENENITREMQFTLPQKTHDRLDVFVYVLTSLFGDSATYAFYATYVRTVTYDELLNNYNGLLLNYSNLFSEYQTLLQSYSTLSDEYDTLNSTYNSLLSQHDALQASYSSLNSTYYDLRGDYDSLQASYNSLETTYNSLNQTYTMLQVEVNSLQNGNNAATTELNNTKVLMYLFVAVTAALAVLIIYIKRKKSEPYIVLRRETVALKPEEKH